MSYTHIENSLTDNPDRAHSAVTDELEALHQRLTEQKENAR